MVQCYHFRFVEKDTEVYVVGLSDLSKLTLMVGNGNQALSTSSHRPVMVFPERDDRHTNKGGPLE